LFLVSCNKPKWEVGEDFQALEIDFKRFDQSLFKLSKNRVTEEDLKQLEKEFPKLYPLYVKAIMRFDEIAPNSNKETFIDFLKDKNIKDLLDTVSIVYPLGSLQGEKELLNLGLSRFHYFFPQNQVPKVRTMISAFTYSTATDDSLLVIGLDNYLGNNFSLYPQVGIPKYLFQNFSKEYMVSDALKAWLTSEFEGGEGSKLLDQMIFNGKILYLTKSLLPEIPAHLIFNYKEEELLWCENNEREIWAHFIDMELLFSDKNFQIRKYMGDAPFIPGFPEGSPGRVGQWVGYQIVNAFMEKQSKVSLEQLMQIENSNKILQESRYKPKL
jgi:hypothetical protein